jgi:hypothetical protein
MITDNQRREVAKRLRGLDVVITSRDTLEKAMDKLMKAVYGERPFSPVRYSVRNLCGLGYALADLIEPQPIDGNTSDGYHTFNELYHHRAVLFSVIVENFAARAWKSKLHADGTMYKGMFIVGIETPDGQATYHYDVVPYWNLFRCKEVDRAPEWDGHTPDQAIERIGKLVDCKTDRPTATASMDYEAMEDGVPDCRIWTCHRCNESFPVYRGFIPAYCQNCGAEVIDEDSVN